MKIFRNTGTAPYSGNGITRLKTGEEIAVPEHAIDFGDIETMVLVAEEDVPAWTRRWSAGKQEELEEAKGLEHPVAHVWDPMVGLLSVVPPIKGEVENDAANDGNVEVETQEAAVETQEVTTDAPSDETTDADLAVAETVLAEEIATNEEKAFEVEANEPVAEVAVEEVAPLVVETQPLVIARGTAPKGQRSSR